MGSCCVQGAKTVTKPGESGLKIFGKNLKRGYSNLSAKRGVKSARGSVYQVNNEDVTQVYNVQEKLGTGYFGTVKLVTPKIDPNKKYAVKSIDKTKLSAQKIKNLSREIEGLASLDHPNIIKYYEIYDDDQYFHIVMEYCSGGELFERIVAKKRLSEQHAAELVYKIASAISHCHANGIVHRDLKPENILFENKSEFSDIKIIDFGLSRKYTDDELHSIVGSPYYVAPEVLDGNYDNKCDIWGIGVLMFVLLSGRPPFYSENKKELFNKIKNDPLPLEKKVWKKISSEAIDLIKDLLQKNPKKRPTAKKILEYTWFQQTMNGVYSNRDIDPEIITALKEFTQPRQLVKSILKYIIKELKSSEIDKLKKIFMIMDKNKTGYIDLAQVGASFNLNKNNDLCQSNLKIQQYGTEVVKVNNFVSDNLKNKKIDYSSFITAALRKKNLLNKDILWETFKHMDVDNSGCITVSDFDKAMKRTGKTKSLEEYIQMFKEVGFEKDAKITFEEFCLLIENDI